MGGGGGSSTTESGLPDWAQPHAERAVTKAVDQYDTGQFGNVAGLTPEQYSTDGTGSGAFNRKLELGQRGGALDLIGDDSYTAAKAYRDAARGGGLFGSKALAHQTKKLEESIGDAQSEQLARLNNQASLGGTLGSARNQAATNRALAQTAGDIAAKELDARRQYSLAGAQGVIGSGGAIGDQLTRGSDITEGVGSALQQQAQNQSDADYQATQRLFGLLGSGVTGQKQVTSQRGK